MFCHRGAETIKTIKPQYIPNSEQTLGSCYIAVSQAVAHSTSGTHTEKYNANEGLAWQEYTRILPAGCYCQDNICSFQQACERSTPVTMVPQYPLRSVPEDRGHLSLNLWRLLHTLQRENSLSFLYIRWSVTGVVKSRCGAEKLSCSKQWSGLHLRPRRGSPGGSHHMLNVR